MTFELPWPPSVNHYWLNDGGRGRRLSDEGNTFRSSVVSRIKQQGAAKIIGDTAVKLTLYLPSARDCDADNRIKPVLDALQHAGIYDDDKCVCLLIVRKVRMPNDRPGCCVCSVTHLEVLPK